MGAYMASAAPKPPNRKSPSASNFVRQSVQMASMRRTWAWTRGSSSRRTTGRRMFMGKCRRRGAKPACISAAIAGNERAQRRLRPQLCCGKFLREVLQDRERFPDAGVRINKHGHLAAAGEGAHARLEVRSIERDDLFLERDVCHFHGKPWPQRPRRVIFIADDELQGHGHRPGRCGGISTGPPSDFQAVKPPAMWATGARPMLWAHCVARAER